MSKEMNKQLRAKCEKLIYDTLDALDPSKTNSEHYKQIFAKMSNEEFKKFISKDLPYRFHVTPFEIEPTMKNVYDAAKILNVPVLEKVSLPFLYKDKNGRSVSTKEALVGYLHLKKVQQFITKKNAMSVDIAQRDMRTGLLISHDKNGKETDREMESLMVNGLNDTLKEFGTIRADYMESKNQAYNTINVTGSLSLEELDIEGKQSLAKNMANAYLIGAGIMSNMINEDYYLPYTLENKKKEISRK